GQNSCLVLCFDLIQIAVVGQQHGAAVGPVMEFAVLAASLLALSFRGNFQLISFHPYVDVLFGIHSGQLAPDDEIALVDVGLGPHGLVFAERPPGFQPVENLGHRHARPRKHARHSAPLLNSGSGTALPSAEYPRCARGKTVPAMVMAGLRVDQTVRYGTGRGRRNAAVGRLREVARVKWKPAGGKNADPIAEKSYLSRVAEHKLTGWHPGPW